MGVPPAGGGNSGVRPAGGVELRFLPPEHSRKVHCYQDYYGPVSGIRLTPGYKGVKVMVGSGVSGTGKYVEGGSGVNLIPDTGP